MKARPILFSGPMVRALLDGRKTQTRRIVKPQPAADKKIGMCHWVKTGYSLCNCLPDGRVGACECKPFPCPYGLPGDLLWVRESFVSTPGFDQPYHFMADIKPGSESDEVRKDYGFKWKPSIHMPRYANRLTLEIVSIRVERLQDITEKDIHAEGAITEEWLEWREDASCIGMPAGSRIENERDKWEQLWDSVNGWGAYQANPWVWVVEFKVHRCNVNKLMSQREAA